jgi:predicted secreted protein
MSKIAAFGTALNMGIQQVDSTPIVGAITGSGNATVTVTKSGMTGSPLAISVAVLNGDSVDTACTKMAAAMNLTANFSAVLEASANGSTLIVRAKTAAANDATMNVAYTNGTCTGLTPDATSDNTTAGVAPTAIAQVQNIGGPGLAADTEDVTTHDSTGGFEEMVVTILRTGEVTLDIEYDPNAATHAATSGLLAKLKDKTFAQYQLVWPGPYTWTFNAWATGFEPGAPFDGALTAAVTLKVTGAPTLV